MSSVVILAGSKRIKPASEAIHWGIKTQIILVGEDDVEFAVQDSRRKIVEVLGDKSNTDEVILSALENKTPVEPQQGWWWERREGSCRFDLHGRVYSAVSRQANQ